MELLKILDVNKNGKSISGFPGSRFWHRNLQGQIAGRSQMSKFTTGFTLVEIIIVLAIFSLLFYFGIFFSFNSYNRYLIRSERDTLLTALYKARSSALNNIRDTSHGVYIEKDQYVIFRGESFNKNDPENMYIERNDAISITGLKEIVFNSLSGNPNQLGSFVLSNGIETQLIYIESEGKIRW